jgi:PAS domain S-box-containing protein
VNNAFQPPSEGPLRILLVEDAEDDADLMLRELHRAGVRCVSARVQTDVELIEALYSFLPDVVLSDHSLPQFTALDALHTIQRERPGTPVIIVTGSLDEETAAEYIKAGAADYIVKHRLHRLGPAVGRAMTLRQAQREAAVAADSQLRSERRFRKLVEYSSDVITLLDGTGTVLYSTQSLKPTLGYGPGEMVGHSVFELVHPEDRPAAERLFRGVAQDASITSRADVRVRHKEGSWRDLEVAVTNHLDDPDVRAMVVNYQDVTDRKRLQQQFFQAQKMEAVGRLAGGVAHDFNNLLTAILGSTDLLLETLPVDHPGRDEGAEIRKAALRAADLTRQLLAFSRQQVLAPRVLDLNDVVANLHKMLRRLIGEDVDLRTTLAEEVGAVRADPGQLEQVIVNLAVNARDAMPNGGKLTIETANVDVAEGKGDAAAVPVVESGAYVLLVVSDTGTGMDAETKARMFEPFFTTKPKGQGTGLGLATVYGIVKQSGGYVWVDSEPGHGTTFKIYLPRVDADVDPQPASPDIRRLNGSETVLLVEDQDQVRELTKRLLEVRGYRVLVAASGPEALQLAEGHTGQIQLLVTDVVMPGMSGREVGLLLAPTHRDMRVLYLSGYPDPSVVDQGVLAPGTPFLQKPFTSEGLARKVREVLDGPTST